MLPSKKYMNGLFGEKDYFIFYKPKNIVSGDFYWIQNIDNQVFIALADCTGHGVPGAFMSTLSNEVLNNTILSKGIKSPKKILESLHEGIKLALRQDEQKGREGLDIALLKIDSSKRKAFFAGAMNPLYIVQKKEIIEVKGTRKSIGGFETKNNFEEHEITIYKDTIFYLCTDGFQDQFGGEQNRKFMVKNLRNLLLENSQKSFEKQKQVLENTLTVWKNDGEQTDDISILGFSVSNFLTI